MEQVYILIKKENRESQLIGAYKDLKNLLTSNDLPDDGNHIDTVNKALNSTGIYFYIEHHSKAYDIYLSPLY